MKSVGANDRAGNVTGTADDRHQQELDARLDAERIRADISLGVRIKPTGKACQKRGDDEDPQTDAELTDPEACHKCLAALERPDRPPCLDCIRNVVPITTRTRQAATR